MKASPLLLVIAVLAVAGCGGGTKTVTQTTTVSHTITVHVTTTASAATGATACTGDSMTGLFTAIPGSAGAGNIGYRLHVTNASPVACFVSGLPNAQLISTTGNDLPTNVVPAQPGQATAARIVLQPGGHRRRAVLARRAGWKRTERRALRAEGRHAARRVRRRTARRDGHAADARLRARHAAVLALHRRGLK
jgi:hypothetical protein